MSPEEVIRQLRQTSLTINGQEVSPWNNNARVYVKYGPPRFNGKVHYEVDTKGRDSVVVRLDDERDNINDEDALRNNLRQCAENNGDFEVLGGADLEIRHRYHVTCRDRLFDGIKADVQSCLEGLYNAFEPILSDAEHNNNIIPQAVAGNAPQNNEERINKQKETTEMKTRNLIVFGAPGTGKSHKLNQMVCSHKNEAGEDVAGCFENADRSERRYERVTFYPTYSYAQFVGTYKPVMKPKANGALGEEEIAYEFVPGPFLRVLVKALNEAPGAEGKKKNWCLVIEEINRANAAAVFGDVFQLLDRGADGVSEYAIAASEDVKMFLKKEVTTADGKKFLGVNKGNAQENEMEDWDSCSLRLPDNMYIWATMNSADQGVFPMDTAFKRRWEFEYINIDNGKEDCVAWTIEGKAYNWNAIREFMNGLLSRHGVNEDKLMGAHFVKAMNNVVSDKTFKSKVLMYLWEDAARMIRRQMFGNVLTYSALCDEWQKSGVKVFENDSELKKENDNSPLKKSYADLAQLATSNGKTGQQPADTDTGHHENPV